VTVPARQMHLNLFLTGEGHHEAAWRHPLSDPSLSASAEHYLWQARTAEAAALESVFVADSLSAFVDIRHTPARDFEPITLLTAIAVATSRIGIVGTMSTTYSEPYNLARQFASLDHISQGRAGWNIVTTAEERSALNFGTSPLASHAERYARASEFLEVAKKLWDSREEGCVIAAKQTGDYADSRRIHPIRHSGTFFRIQGPLNIGRSPQGYPLLFQAGSSPDGRDFAAHHAEVVFTVQQDLPGAKSFYDDIKSRAAAHGRDPRLVKILPGVVTTIESTESAAIRRARELDDLVVPARALAALEERLGISLSSLPLDEPLPELPKASEYPGQQGRYEIIRQLANDEHLTLRQILRRLGPGRGHRSIAGSPEQIADALETWFANGAADGFTLMPALLPDDLIAFTRDVVPILCERGLRSTDYVGRTLRQHYGHSNPANSFAAELAAALARSTSTSDRP
jgi:FMN-dependent oxidoreductase (nitrilotriacetate monooxygenase family)